MKRVKRAMFLCGPLAISLIFFAKEGISEIDVNNSAEIEARLKILEKTLRDNNISFTKRGQFKLKSINEREPSRVKVFQLSPDQESKILIFELMRARVKTVAGIKVKSFKSKIEDAIFCSFDGEYVDDYKDEFLTLYHKSLRFIDFQNLLRAKINFKNSEFEVNELSKEITEQIIEYISLMLIDLPSLDLEGELDQHEFDCSENSTFLTCKKLTLFTATVAAITIFAPAFF